jgi:poly(A) polymerase
VEPTPALIAARRVARKLRRAGHDAWIAGGAVRDWLLGVPPHDADVATSARPDEVCALFPEAKLVGASFGVALVPEGDESIEVATFRTEGVYLDGRRPSEVRFGTLEEDVRRRDFTVNGMFLDPETEEIRDLVGGRADLERRILRAIGDPAARFREDHLRLLRAVRFAAQLGFGIEPDTAAAIRAAAPHAAEVAAERTRDELVRMLTGPDGRRALDLLHHLGLLAVLLPEIQAMEGVGQPEQYHPEGDVLTHTKLLFDHLENPSPELAFGALLHDVGKPPTYEEGPDRIRFPRHAKVGAEMAREICHRLRFSNESCRRIVELVAHHMRFLDIERMKTSTLKRFLRQPGFDEHLALHRADCLASHRKLEHWEFAGRKLEELGEEELRPPRLVDGRDLMGLGWERGPALGRELKRLEELQLDGGLSTREEALEQARRDLEAAG